MGRGVPEYTKAKQSLAAQVRWRKMSEEKAKELAKEISSGMKSYWSRKTKEERSAIAKKAAATRKANQIARAQARGKS